MARHTDVQATVGKDRQIDMEFELCTSLCCHLREQSERDWGRLCQALATLPTKVAGAQILPVSYCPTPLRTSLQCVLSLFKNILLGSVSISWRKENFGVGRLSRGLVSPGNRIRSTTWPPDVFCLFCFVFYHRFYGPVTISAVFLWIYNHSHNETEIV